MINYWYETHGNENNKTWHVEIIANSDRIGYYENCSTKVEAITKAESFIDGVNLLDASSADSFYPYKTALKRSFGTL